MNAPQQHQNFFQETLASRDPEVFLRIVTLEELLCDVNKMHIGTSFLMILNLGTTPGFG